MSQNIATSFISEHMAKYFKIMKTRKSALSFFLLRPSYTSEYWSEDGILMADHLRSFSLSTNINDFEKILLLNYSICYNDKPNVKEFTDNNLTLVSNVSKLIQDNIETYAEIQNIPFPLSNFITEDTYSFLILDGFSVAGNKDSNLVRAYARKLEDPKWSLHPDWEDAVFEHLNYCKSLSQKKTSESNSFDEFSKIQETLCPNATMKHQKRKEQAQNITKSILNN
tara:strand:- start:127 stop:801 length:675 start_codon:yes stop_codon:yes gene_type:complete